MFDNIDLNMMMKIFMIQRADDDNKFDDDDKNGHYTAHRAVVRSVSSYY